jgi:GNAT superfamily N-acetyltransferase
MPFDKQTQSFSMPTPETLTQASFVIMALGGAAMELLDRLAIAHGNIPGPWLDELEEVLIRAAKGIIADGIHISDEARGMKLGIELLDALIQRQRRRFIVTDE